MDNIDQNVVSEKVPAFKEVLSYSDLIPKILVNSTRGQLGKLAFLSFLLAGFSGCNENSPANPCESSSFHDVNVDAGNLGNDAGKPSSSIPTTTLPILKHSMDCYRAFQDTYQWCDNNILARTPSDPKFCDYTFLENPEVVPKKIRDICEKKTEECKTPGVTYKKFSACLDSIPADPKCKAVLRPLSNGQDSDGDGLSDHFELWHSHTNPCEPCSFGDVAPCDADAVYGNSGMTNKDATYFHGGCTSFLGTEECG